MNECISCGAGANPYIRVPPGELLRMRVPGSQKRAKCFKFEVRFSQTSETGPCERRRFTAVLGLTTNRRRYRGDKRLVYRLSQEASFTSNGQRVARRVFGVKSGFRRFRLDFDGCSDAVKSI